LADALRRARDFIQAIETSVGDDFVWKDAWKRVGEDNKLSSNKCPRKDEGWLDDFTQVPSVSS